MKKKCYEELNEKYSQILKKKIEEIHKTILKDVQNQNQKILDNYVKKFEDFEKKREEDYNNSMSKIMLSNVQKEGEINVSFVKTTHHGIKCNKCGIEPIVGYRYKCPICKNYNLCQNCELKNAETGEHQHDFIKMRNEEKQPKKQEKKSKEKEKDKDKEKKIIKNDEKKQQKKEEKKEEKLPPKIPREKIEYKFELLDKNPENYSKTVFIEDQEEKEIKFEIDIKNSSIIDFPGNGKTKLISDKVKTNIMIQDRFIDELKAGESQKIILNIPKQKLNLGKNEINLYLNIDGKNCGNQITLIIFYKSKKVQQFRTEFSLSEKEYDEQRLYSALQKNQYDNSKAFASLFD